MNWIQNISFVDIPTSLSCITYRGKVLINCASVGVPTNGQTATQFVTIEFVDGKWNNKLISVPYDIDKIIADFEESGLNDRACMWAAAMIKLLRTGRNYPLECLNLAIQKAHRADPGIDASDIPEEFWEAAAKELEMI